MSIDFAVAKKKLKNAYDTSLRISSPNNEYSSLIKEVILGTHLTYRYILINALLAKSTNESINPLTLQASSNLPGAYDARSLCHKVLVPFEREYLNSKIGGSNEPFLNKPARNTELSETNPVRKGYDSKILSTVIAILSSTYTQKEAYDRLVTALYFVGERTQLVFTDFTITNTCEIRKKVNIFFERLVSLPYNGESAVLAVGMALYLSNCNLDKKLNIQVHPTNQSGASTQEVLDIDIYLESKILYSIEVKDKLFSKIDFEHAIQKAKRAGLLNFYFILGNQARCTDAPLEELTFMATRNGINVILIHVLSFVSIIIDSAGVVSFESLAEIINEITINARMKDNTKNHVAACMKTCI